MSSKNFLALDVGSRRIGLAMADSQVKIAVPFGWLKNNENIVQEITELVLRHDIDTIVVGYPRNQSGEPTKQTEFVEEFVKQFEDIELDTEIVFQDESLTSVQAEQRLGNKIKDKGEIDAEAASIILQDFLEENYENS
jgi:RNAse H domain protein, YqgF family